MKIPATKNEIKDYIIELTNELNKLNHAYYNLDKPLVDDFVYDSKLRELEELEIKYPEFIQEDSPTTKIGGVPSLNFSKYTHQKPMLSLAKAYSQEEVNDFIKNATAPINSSQINFNLEPKIDGLSISLIYKDGKLANAVTRGDGKVGEDVTKNALIIKSIPKTINYLKPIEIRGEIYINKSKFLEINQQLKEEFEEKKLEFINKTWPAYLAKLGDYNNGKIKALPKEPKEPTEDYFANTRNMAAGTLRQKNGKLIIQRDLQIIMYDIVDPLEHGLKEQSQIVDFLKSLNLPTHQYHYVEKDFQSIIKRINEFELVKDSFKYDCDGFVIKLNQLEYWDLLGKTAKFPRYAIAYKYKTEEAYPIIKKIVATVGRTGKITYVASFDPVELVQTTVSNATLHNYDFISNMNINIGDQVVLIKSGEIIPKIIELKTKYTNSIFPKVLNCPSCNSVLVEYPGIVDQFCENPNCYEKLTRNLSFFVSRDALNIVSLSEKTLNFFFDKGWITDQYSIFNLKDKADEILEFFKENSSNPDVKIKIADKRLSNILVSIEEAKNVELHKALFALGIKNIGLVVAKTISEKLTKLSDLFEINLDEYLLINSIGPEIVQSLKDFVTDNKNKELIQKLDSVLIYKSSNNEPKSDKLKNQTFVITGTHSVSRDELSKIIEQNGGTVSSSISSKTNYLVAGENVGATKFDKANKLNVPIISEQDLYEMIK
ncbi:NAD-dependent DNA ligase LigA [Mycoplasma sp. 2045]|uniref:NAD-dependent DNA ligase LigA n=1 Tax=Mycoplasma sp. 2045 TaxID=2967301 RepID=UPI00211BF35A|nr:NAD-dependent DNA ligase LigA [Mycoplasma sp. 2045]UUM20394.1 NAD-dependent DNA ligase LigA [Mycoplasma sp. 2045]